MDDAVEEIAPEALGVSSLSAGERETTVNASDGDRMVRIWTAQRRHITQLRKKAQFTEVASGRHGTTEWAEFEIPADMWNPATGAKRQHVELSADRKRQMAERLAAARARKDAVGD